MTTKRKIQNAISLIKKSFPDLQESTTLLEIEALAKNYQETVPAMDLSKQSFILPDGNYSEDHIFTFSDGACRGNPGIGGYGVVIQRKSDQELIELKGFSAHTTNNKMELKAAIEALRYPKDHLTNNESLSLYSDSKYVVNGINTWVASWKSRGWRKADKKEPENIELWKEFDELRNFYTKFEAIWVKAHNGHPQNERCDQLANIAIDESK